MPKEWSVGAKLTGVEAKPKGEVDIARSDVFKMHRQTRPLAVIRRSVWLAAFSGHGLDETDQIFRCRLESVDGGCLLRSPHRLRKVEVGGLL